MPVVLSKEQKQVKHKPESQAPETNQKVLKQACAYRVKYLVTKKQKLPWAVLAVDMGNRSQSKAIYPNEEDVRHLGISIYQDGFSLDIANFDGTAVQEIPTVERAKLEKEYERQLHNQREEAKVRFAKNCEDSLVRGRC